MTAAVEIHLALQICYIPQSVGIFLSIEKVCSGSASLWGRPNSAVNSVSMDGKRTIPIDQKKLPENTIHDVEHLLACAAIAARHI